MKTLALFLIFVTFQSHAEPFIEACDRSPDVRIALELAWSRPCEQIFRTQINTTTYLEIWTVRGIEIKAGDFSEMAELKGISFRARHYLTIDPREFENTPQLSYLSIIGAPMGELSADFTRHLRGLENLLISNTGLHTIQPRALENLPNLTHLDLSSNAFTKIERAMLAGATKLMFVDLSDCVDLQEIEEDTFADFTQMKQIKVRFSPLKRTSKGAFHGIPEVEDLPANFGSDDDNWGGQ